MVHMFPVTQHCMTEYHHACHAFMYAFALQIQLMRERMESDQITLQEGFAEKNKVVCT